MNNDDKKKAKKKKCHLQGATSRILIPNDVHRRLSIRAALILEMKTILFVVFFFALPFFTYENIDCLFMRNMTISKTSATSNEIWNAHSIECTVLLTFHKYCSTLFSLSLFSLTTINNLRSLLCFYRGKKNKYDCLGAEKIVIIVKSPPKGAVNSLVIVALHFTCYSASSLFQS